MKSYDEVLEELDKKEAQDFVDRMARAVVTGFYSDEDTIVNAVENDDGYEVIAEVAYNQAYAMLQERNKRIKENK